MATPNERSFGDAPRDGTKQFLVRCVLVVDGNVSVRRVIVRALWDAGFQTVEACDVGEAIQILHGLTVSPLAIISDIDMPRLSVMRLVEQARHLDASVPILLLSGGHDDQETGQAIARGDVGLLSKPFAGSELLLRLREEIRTQGAGRPGSTALPDHEDGW